jgi:Na+/glutamate symporter
VLAGIVAGALLGLILGILIGSILWFTSNPSISEMESAVEENLNLTDEQHERVMEMARAGTVIDLVIHLFLASVTALCLGAGIGLLAAFLWYRFKVLPIKATGNGE